MGGEPREMVRRRRRGGRGAKGNGEEEEGWEGSQEKWGIEMNLCNGLHKHISILSTASLAKIKIASDTKQYAAGLVSALDECEVGVVSPY